MLQITYEKYNSSWEKFLLSFSASGICRKVGDKSAISINGLKYETIRSFEFSKKTPFLIGELIMIGYHIHNLYSEYEHNKSLEVYKKLKLENDEIIDVKQTTQDWSIFTVYNVLGGLSDAASISSMFFDCDKLVTILGLLTIGAKFLHITSSDFAGYEFTNADNGSIVDMNTLIHGDWID